MLKVCTYCNKGNKNNPVCFYCTLSFRQLEEIPIVKKAKI